MQVPPIIDRVLEGNALGGVRRRLSGRIRPVPRHGEAPLLSGSLPVLGHTVEFIRSTIDLLTRANRELGEVAAVRVANKRMVVLFGPEAHEAVFRAPDEQLDPREAYAIMTPVFGEGIVYDAPPDRMDAQLKMLLPALKDRRMRTYGQTIVGEVERAIADWGDEGEVDLVAFCRVLTNYTSAHCLLGREFREGMTSEFAEIYHTLERGVTPLSYISHRLPLPSFRARDAARVRLVELIGGIIDARRREGRVGEDFLQTLMETTYKDGTPLTEDEITGMLLAAMFAGHHTSSVTTSWTLLELLQHPACRRTVVDQVDALFGEGQEIGFESLRAATEVEWAVLESLRLHPPLFMLVRVVKKTFQYKGYTFEPGTWIIVSPTVAHRMPEVFDDATCFDPQRFSPERAARRNPWAFIAFGGGRHKCLGNAFALLQVKAILSILLRDYEFALGDDPIGSDFHGLVIGPSEPCRIRYRRRTPESRRGKVARSLAKAAAAPSAAAGRCPVPHGAAAQAKAGPFRVVADLDLCKSHAVCMGEAPEVFFVGDESQVEVLRAQPGADLRPAVELAVQHCPTGALRIEEL